MFVWYDRHIPYICCSNLAKFKFSLVQYSTRLKVRTETNHRQYAGMNISYFKNDIVLCIVYLV